MKKSSENLYTFFVQILPAEMVEERQAGDDKCTRRTQEHHSRGDVFEFSDDRVVFRFHFIEQILEERVHDFRSQDEENGEDDKGNLDEGELQRHAGDQCKSARREVNFEIPLFTDHGVKSAERVTKAAEEDAGHVLQYSVPVAFSFIRFFLCSLQS